MTRKNSLGPNFWILAPGGFTTCGAESAAACKRLFLNDLYGANGEGRTPMPFRALEPKSRASANSATFAQAGVNRSIPTPEDGVQLRGYANLTVAGPSGQGCKSASSR